MLGISELVILVFIPLLVLPLVALINVLKHRFAGNDKLIWVLVILLLPVIGAVLYFFIGHQNRIPADKGRSEKSSPFSFP
jgi:hypothetical protein